MAACSSSSSSVPQVPVSTRLAAGVAALRQHDYSAAEGLLSQVTKLEPRNFTAYYDLGVAYQAQGANRAALIAYAKAQAINERFVPPLAQVSPKVPGVAPEAPRPLMFLLFTFSPGTPRYW